MSDAAVHLYKRVCPSVGPSVRWCHVCENRRNSRFLRHQKPVGVRRRYSHLMAGCVSGLVDNNVVIIFSSKAEKDDKRGKDDYMQMEVKNDDNIE